MFRFLIEEINYCWHQPKELVDWPYVTTSEPETWANFSEEKPVAMPARQFADAKALLRYVVKAIQGGQKSDLLSQVIEPDQRAPQVRE